MSFESKTVDPGAEPKLTSPCQNVEKMSSSNDGTPNPGAVQSNRTDCMGLYKVDRCDMQGGKLAVPGLAPSVSSM